GAIRKLHFHAVRGYIQRTSRDQYREGTWSRDGVVGEEISSLWLRFADVRMARSRPSRGHDNRGRGGMRLIGRRAVAGLIMLALAVPGATAIPAGAAPPAGPPLSWHRCDLHFRCAELSVPVNYAAPTGAHLDLSLVELLATGAHVIGDLVTNPGGPGGSGVQFLETTSFPAGLRASFNLVSFDPRGIGQSDPVTCEGPSGIRALTALNPEPRTAGEVATLVQAVKAFDRSCTEHTPMPLL